MTEFKDIAEKVCTQIESWGHHNLSSLIMAYRIKIDDWVDLERKRKPSWEYIEIEYILEWSSATRKLDRLLRGELPWSNQCKGVYPMFDGYLKCWKPDKSKGLLDAEHILYALVDILAIIGMPLNEIMNEVTSDKPYRRILAQMVLERR